MESASCISDGLDVIKEMVVPKAIEATAQKRKLNVTPLRFRNHKLARPPTNGRTNNGESSNTSKVGFNALL